MDTIIQLVFKSDHNNCSTQLTQKTHQYPMMMMILMVVVLAYALKCVIPKLPSIILCASLDTQMCRRRMMKRSQGHTSIPFPPHQPMDTPFLRRNFNIEYIEFTFVSDFKCGAFMLFWQLKNIMGCFFRVVAKWSIISSTIFI